MSEIEIMQDIRDDYLEEGQEAWEEMYGVLEEEYA